MKREHVIDSYQNWNENRLEAEERREIQRHLKGCVDCRQYFEKMSLLLDQHDPSFLPHLEPDPFLPTRIRALAEGGEVVERENLRRAVGWLRLSVASALTLVAVTTGAYLGLGLSATNGSADDSEIIAAYYDAFSQSEFASGWDDLVENGQEEDS